MRTILSFLLDIHPFLSFMIISIVFVLFVIVCITIVKKLFSEKDLTRDHEVEGIIFNAFGLLYAVLVAFVVFATWNSYDTSKKNVEMEASKLSELFMDAGAFDDPIKKEIRYALIEYTKAVIEHEWPIMASGERVPQKAIESYRNIWNKYRNIDVKKIKNRPMYEESLRQLNSMSEYRRFRWYSCRSSTPRVMWIVLLVGGIMSVSYTFFFGKEHILAQYVLTAIYTIMNVMVLFLIYILDHQFKGYSAISNEPFMNVLRIFQRIFEQ